MTLHRSSEDNPGHMNTGIEWPVYAYVGHEGSEGEEVARLRAENALYKERLTELMLIAREAQLTGSKLRALQKIDFGAWVAVEHSK